MNIETQFKHIIEHTYEIKIKPSNAPRCSSLSKFCPVSFVIGQMQRVIEESCSKDFYCSVGTAVHSVIQTWAGIRGHLYGKWRCSQCERLIYEGFGPVEHCGVYCDYEEYQLNYKILSGHCDGILEEDNEFYVMELKTISLGGLQKRIKENKPYDYHCAQANFYTLMSQKLKLPKPLVGYTIIYIARDNPNIIKVFKHKGVDLNKVKSTIKLFKETQQMLETGIFKNIQKYCPENEIDTFCTYRSICTRPDIEDELRRLYEG